MIELTEPQVGASAVARRLLPTAPLDDLRDEAYEAAMDGVTVDRAWWNRWPILIFAAIVLTFVASTAIAHWQMRVLDEAVVEIANTTGPGIERLAAARVQARDLQTALRDRPLGANDAKAVDSSSRALRASVDGYIALPVAARERPLWLDIFESRAGLEGAVERYVSQAERGGSESARAEVAIAASHLDGALTRAIAFNIVRARTLADEITRLRTAALYVAVALDTICIGVTVCGAILLRRLGRAHENLAATHLRLQEERACELEDFAGRVAHDILSPLSTVGMALELAERPSDPEITDTLQRGTAAVQRVKRLVAGLLDFARAGAAPDPDAHTDVAEVIRDLRDELEPTASAAGVELTMNEDTPGAVSCNPGVLTSLVANLTRNAIKYIGDGPTRRVVVRAFALAESVRVEVEDTGPGLPPDVERRAFDPYARARGATQPGIGLGLATVKRLAEAHQGNVGVKSVLGEGCTFWFELPKATPVPVAPHSHV